MLNLNKKKNDEDSGKKDFMVDYNVNKDFVEEPAKPDFGLTDEVVALREQKRNNKKGDQAPVISTYNQVKFDIYNLFQEFSKAFGSFKALESINRIGSKEARHYAQIMTSYALQFHSLVDSGWGDTKKRMLDNDLLVLGVDVCNKHGDIWFRFNKLCLAANDGGALLNPDKYVYSPIKFTPENFSLINGAISRFLQFSGITAIEGRFIDDDDSKQFNYGG